MDTRVPRSAACSGRAIMLNRLRCDRESSTLQSTNLLHYMQGQKIELAECEFGKKFHHDISPTTDAQIDCLDG